MRTRSALAVPCAVLTAVILSPPAFAVPVDVNAEVNAQPQPRVVVSGLARPTGIVAADRETLLIAVAGSATAFGGQGAVVQIDLATGELTVLELGGSAPLRVAVDAEGRPLWSSPAQGKVWRRHADGAARKVVSEASAVSGLALDGRGRLYFTSAPADSSGGRISQVSMLDGDQVTVLRASEPEPTDITAGRDGDLYWTNASAGAIVHQNPGGVLEVVVSGLDRPYGLCLDESRGLLYFTEVPTPGVAGDAGGRNAVSVLDLGSRAITVISRGDAEPSDVAVTPDGRVFWVSTATGTVVEAADQSDDRESGDTFSARLAGSEEVPAVESSAGGEAKFELHRAEGEDDDDGPAGLTATSTRKKVRLRLPREAKPPKNEANLEYELKLRRISGLTMAHLHLGPAGSNGPVVVTLFQLPSAGGSDAKLDAHGYVSKSSLVGPFAGDWDAFMAALISGQIYVNVHTASNPAGEIRGQLVPPGGQGGNHPPNGTIITPPGDVAIQVGATVSFAGQATDPDGDMVKVKWNFGDDGKSEELVPAPHQYREAGEFTVTFTVTDARGLIDPTPDRLKVRVSTSPPSQTPTPTSTPPLPTPTPTNTPVTPPAATPTPTNTPAAPPPATPTPTNTPVAPPPATPTPTNTPVAPPPATPTPTNTPVAPPPTATPPPPTPTPTNTPLPPTPTNTPVPPPPTPTPTPTTPGVTLSFLQTNIFTPKCIGCHGASSPEAGMSLTAGMSYTNLVNVAATSSSSPMLRVKPLDPANSYLSVFLASGHRSSSVTATDRANIDAWILAGAGNN